MRPSQLSIWRSIPGWCTNIEGDYLQLFAWSCPKGSVIVDIGTYLGRSAAAFGLGCLSSGARVISVDHFEGNPEHTVKPSMEHALVWLEHVDPKLPSVVTIVPEDAIAFAKSYTKKAYAFYVDTEHTGECVLNTFAAWWPKLSSKGHVLFHDARNSGWKEVVNTVQSISERWPLEEMIGADSIRHFKKLT